MVSIITPSYNRAHLLGRLYMSLCKQIDMNFEWIVIDDGSTDDTSNLLGELQKEHNKPFLLKYRKKNNGGKHTAINEGVKYAQGELVLILDSDDSLPDNSISTIEYYYEQIKDDVSFGGVCGYMAHHDGAIIGHGCDFDVLDTNSIDIRYKYHLKGDLAEVFKRDVLLEFPFPEIEGEKFCPESLVWNRIATKYRLRFFNKVIYYRDYLEGGLTDYIVKIRMDSPVASMMTYSEMLRYKIPFVQKIKASVNYWRFAFCVGIMSKKVQLPCLWIWTIPMGYLMHMKDKKTVK